MSKIKFTGTNIAAAILILFYFFPWVDVTAFSLSGFAITSKGVSPGLFSYFVSGIGRFYMVLAILVPLCAALILNQNITGSNKFSKYYKAAHIIPALYFIIGIVGLYFKMKPELPDIPEGYENTYNQMSAGINDMGPGVFDVLAFGVYISLLASVYLLLVSFGKIKDKEYYKPAAAIATTENKSLPSGDTENKENI